jgi:WD40 repeat protein
VFGARFSPDGSRVLTWSNDNTAQVWDSRTGERIGKPLQHRGWVTNARFDPGGQLVVTGSFDCTAQVWDAATGDPIGPALQHRGWVDSVEFSPDGKQVLTAADSQDRVNPEICRPDANAAPGDAA